MSSKYIRHDYDDNVRHVRQRRRICHINYFTLWATIMLSRSIGFMNSQNSIIQKVHSFTILSNHFVSTGSTSRNRNRFGTAVMMKVNPKKRFFNSSLDLKETIVVPMSNKNNTSFGDKQQPPKQKHNNNNFPATREVLPSIHDEKNTIHEQSLDITVFPLLETVSSIENDNLPPAESIGVILDKVPYISSEEIDIKHNQEKNIMLFLLWSIAVLSALDRVAMSVALVPMSAEFGFTDTMKGSISSLFSVGYGLAILPAGLWVANASPKLVLACGISLWSIATIATPNTAELLTTTVVGASATIAPLLLARACVGAGESLVLPTAQRFLTVWTSADQKGFAIALIFSGFQMGTIAAYLLSPILMDALGGWRALFYVYGGTGLAMLIPWLLLAKDTPLNRKDLHDGSPALKVTESSTASLVTEYPTDNGKELNSQSTSWEESLRVFNDAPWKDMFYSKGAWAMLLAHCARNWGLYNTLSWTPTFYAEAYGIGVRESAILSLLPSVAGGLGGFVAGYSADAILRKIQQQQQEANVSETFNNDKAKTNVRKIFQGISLFGSAAALGTLALHIPEEAWVSQAFLTASLGLLSFSAAGFDAGIQDKAGEKWAGLLYSVTSLPAVMFGTVGVWVTGRVLDLTDQDWTVVFSITSVINILGATAFVILFNSKREFE